MTTPKAMTLARSLYADGWTIREIERYLAEQGVSRSWPTIKEWACPGFAERNRLRKKAGKRTRRADGHLGRLGRTTHSVLFQETRARQLADARVPYTTVARVMAFDYPGAGWTYQRVTGLLGPARERAAAAAVAGLEGAA